MLSVYATHSYNKIKDSGNFFHRIYIYILLRCPTRIYDLGSLVLLLRRATKLKPVAPRIRIILPLWARRGVDFLWNVDQSLIRLVAQDSANQRWPQILYSDRCVGFGWKHTLIAISLFVCYFRLWFNLGVKVIMLHVSISICMVNDGSPLIGGWALSCVQLTSTTLLDQAI